MDAFDWYHLLMPAAIVMCMINFLITLALKPPYRSALLNKCSLFIYSGCLIGTILMRFAFSLKNMNTMDNVAITGWLILVPSILLATVCSIARLTKDKTYYNLWALRFLNLLKNCFKFVGLLMAKILHIVFFFLSCKPSKRAIQAQQELEACQKSPYLFDDAIFWRKPHDGLGGYDPNKKPYE